MLSPFYLDRLLPHQPHWKDRAQTESSSGFSEADHVELAVEPGLGAKFPQLVPSVHSGLVWGSQATRGRRRLEMAKPCSGCLCKNL